MDGSYADVRARRLNWNNSDSKYTDRRRRSTYFCMCVSGYLYRPCNAATLIDWLNDWLIDWLFDLFIYLLMYLFMCNANID